MKKIAFLLLAFVALTAFSVYDYTCINLPASPFNYANIPFPDDIVNNLEAMDNTPPGNDITDAGATLGRVLFYDTDLSRNHSISCASCHKQEFSFSDTAYRSVGFNGGLTHRNSMNLNHARFHRDTVFFWDGRAASLELQVLMPMQDTVEMGMTLDSVLARVSAKSFYPPLFQAAFGTPDVSIQRISFALSQFIRSMNTFGSKFRQGVETNNGNPSVIPFTNFTAEENLGKNLFMDTTKGNCQACHTRNIFVPQGLQNIGLDSIYSDNGLGAVTNNHTKDGKFKVPSLINVELTPPYMHDGRFNTLLDVINFYSDSIKGHVNLSPHLKDSLGHPRRPHFTPTEKAALIAFLKTLTDTIITTDERWSNPFCLTEVTGVKEPKPALIFDVYPNPVNAGQNLHFKMVNGNGFNGAIKIFSLQGKLLYSYNLLFNSGENTFDLSTANFSEGIYFLTIQKGNVTIATRKIIVAGQ